VPVAEGVEADAEHVVGAEVEVAAEVAHAHGRRALVVPAARPDVQVVVVVEDGDLGVERGRIALARLDLPEATHHGRRRPVGFVQPTVQRDGPGGPPRLDPQGLRGGRKRFLRQGPGRGDQEERQHGRRCEARVAQRIQPWMRAGG
jgi:hypothetical protein